MSVSINVNNFNLGPTNSSSFINFKNWKKMKSKWNKIQEEARLKLIYIRNEYSKF